MLILTLFEYFEQDITGCNYLHFHKNLQLMDIHYSHFLACKKACNCQYGIHHFMTIKINRNTLFTIHILLEKIFTTGL